METTNTTRANRIAITATANGYTADLYKTHKHICTINSTTTAWKPEENTNKTAQREAFRVWVCDHAESLGFVWQPEDLRTPANTRIASYFSDEILAIDIQSLLTNDITNHIANHKQADRLSLKSIEVDSINPTTTTAKGFDLSKMGVIYGKYEKNGNWAWATMPITITITVDGKDEIYVTATMELVSGQLKKPNLTKTTFAKSIDESLAEIDSQGK